MNELRTLARWTFLTLGVTFGALWAVVALVAYLGGDGMVALHFDQFGEHVFELVVLFTYVAVAPFVLFLWERREFGSPSGENP